MQIYYHIFRKLLKERKADGINVTGIIVFYQAFLLIDFGYSLFWRIEIYLAFSKFSCLVVN